MVNSFDRLLVVSMPLVYFKRATFIVVTEIVVAVLSVFLLGAYTIISAIVEDRNNASDFCRQPTFLPRKTYMVNICFRLFASVHAVLIMLIVLCLLKLRSTKSIEKRADPSVRNYLAKQSNFTKAMLVSCFFTLLLDTVPDFVVMTAGLNGVEDERDYVTYTRIVCMLNAINMVVVILWRKTEVRDILLQQLRKIYLLPKKGAVVATEQFSYNCNTTLANVRNRRALSTVA
ncbi:unnamed protein product [Toxocara canis]|uniref:G_PROTEIN_RECEP_F1_2 domain-containing protein n=1 Tax=Toxocara canis TaxID=6265 RepID=A0A183V362_TOXCA|nr:unnamed protein product [Toxocara canis]